MDATSIVLMIEGRYYLMDHTAIGSVSIPVTDKEKHEPGSLYFWMPGVEMRWYLDPSKNAEGHDSALAQLRDTIQLMNDYLEPTKPGNTPEVRALLPASKAIKGLNVGTGHDVDLKKEGVARGKASAQNCATSAQSADSYYTSLDSSEASASVSTPATSQEIMGSGCYTGVTRSKTDEDTWASCKARLQGAAEGG